MVKLMSEKNNMVGVLFKMLSSKSKTNLKTNQARSKESETVEERKRPREHLQPMSVCFRVNLPDLIYLVGVQALCHGPCRYHIVHNTF